MIEGAVISWAEDAKNFVNSLKSELGIIYAEANNNITAGKSFSVRVPNKLNLDISQCKCGVSYLPVKKWSDCVSINKSEKFLELEFAPSEWINDAVPCFMDLYLLLVEKDGTKHAGTVKIRIQEVK